MARDDEPDGTAKLGRIRMLWQRFRANEALLFADEMDVGLPPKIGSQWYCRGARVVAPTPSKNQKAYVGAALDFHTSPAERFRRVWVVVDNYDVHEARLVRQWPAAHPQIQLVWLPRDCPQANPIERVFGEGHDAITRNHRYGALPKLVAAVLHYLRSHSWWNGTLPSIHDPQRRAKLQAAA